MADFERYRRAISSTSRPEYRKALHREFTRQEKREYRERAKKVLRPRPTIVERADRFLSRPSRSSSSRRRTSSRRVVRRGIGYGLFGRRR